MPCPSDVGVPGRHPSGSQLSTCIVLMLPGSRPVSQGSERALQASKAEGAPRQERRASRGKPRVPECTLEARHGTTREQAQTPRLWHAQTTIEQALL